MADTDGVGSLNTWLHTAVGTTIPSGLPDGVAGVGTGSSNIHMWGVSRVLGPILVANVVPSKYID